MAARARAKAADPVATSAAAGAGPLTRQSPIEDRWPVIRRRLRRAYPDAKVALDFTNPLECLVATILSAQTTDQNVNRVTQGPNGLFAKYRTAEDYLRVPVEELAADLITLPGVARKTANIVQGNAYPREHARDPDAGMAVDTHVGRLARRIGFT